MNPTPEAINSAIELTPIIIAIIGGLFATIRAVAVYYIDKRVKDRALAEQLDNAVVNSLGVLQQVASGQVLRLDPRLSLPERYARFEPAISYVLTHAGEAARRFGVTPEKIAEKVISRIGLREIETNIAVTASPATAAIVPPLAPSPPGTTAAQLNREELARQQGALSS